MKPLVLIPQYFGSLVFDRRNSRYLPFDQECTGLLREAADKPARADLAEYLHASGFWTLDGSFDGEILPLTPPAGHLAGPLAVHLEVTASCNLTCTHCFAGQLPRKEPALSLTELDDLFGQLAALGCFRLGLTGGEPLLRRELLEILDCATGHGLHPCLTTNALLLNASLAQELGRRPLVWLNVSLEGASAESNDPVRGQGTWERVRDKVELLRRHARFTMAFTISSRNAGEVAECADLARRWGASAAVFRPVYPAGTALNHLDLMPTYESYVAALDSLQGDRHLLDPFTPASRHRVAGRSYSGPGCGAANLVSSVSLGGTVNPCSFLGEGFALDNLRDRPFREIWNDGQAFQQLRGKLPEDFQGGCRARSQALAGSVHARDPWHDAFMEGGGFTPAANFEVGQT